MPCLPTSLVFGLDHKGLFDREPRGLPLLWANRISSNRQMHQGRDMHLVWVSGIGRGGWRSCLSALMGLHYPRHSCSRTKFNQRDLNNIYMSLLHLNISKDSRVFQELAKTVISDLIQLSVLATKKHDLTLTFHVTTEEAPKHGFTSSKVKLTSARLPSVAFSAEGAWLWSSATEVRRVSFVLPRRFEKMKYDDYNFKYWNIG